MAPRPEGPREGLRLFAKVPGGFQTVPIQVDPVDSDGHIIFYDDAYFPAKALSRDDMITFRVDDFGVALDEVRDELPCRGSVIYELKNVQSGAVAYLTNCGHQGGNIKYPQLVSFDKKDHRLESATYRYRFNPDNYMQFDKIEFRDDHGLWQLAASDSRLLIRADVRHFFTMNFDSQQIESRLEENRLGPVGNLARVSFYLRVLFFKLAMSLATDVSFFSDSGHIPMMVNLPVNAYEYLHPASGILYSWLPSPLAHQGGSQVDMPKLDVALVYKGFENLGASAAKFCVADTCRFRYSADVAAQRLSMDLEVARKLVARGFFPQFVDDVSRFAETMGWKIDIPKDQHRVGIYLEVSGLPEGGHPWDFWLQLGSAKIGPSNCPSATAFETWPRKTR